MARDARRAAALPAVAVLAVLAAQSAPGTPGGGNGHQGGHVPPYPRYSPALEWPLEQFQAYRIWAHTQGARVTIAVIDTGIDAGQPGLSGTVTVVKDLWPGPKGEDLSKDSHGTEVAGLIAASGSRSNPQRMAGLAPEASLIDVRVAADTAKVTPAEIAAGIEAAVHADASIINVSLGTRTKDRHLTSAVRKAEKKGLLIVASAGTTNPVPYPARYPGVLRVAAATQTDIPQSPLSSGGLALYAPGSELSSTAEVSGAHQIHGYQHGITGPDYAAAYVSAAAALVLSADPGLRPAKAGPILVNSAPPMTGGASPGLLMPLAAVQSVLVPGKHHQNNNGSGGNGSGGKAGGTGKKTIAGTGLRLPVFGWADVLLALVFMLAVMSAVIWRRRPGHHEPTVWDGP